jgi:sugar phosphate isomerase/epimerase
MMNRRQFIGKSAMGIGTALIASQVPGYIDAAESSKAMKKPLGFQIWTIKNQLLKDFPGTLKEMAGMGYKTVEMCSPVGYGFKELINMKGAEMKKIVEDQGLKLVSCHYGMKEFRNNLDERINWAKDAGMKQMVIASFEVNKNSTMSDWQKSVDELNEFGARSKKAGIQMVYHNHDMEFEKLDGVLIYDELMRRFDPDLVKMQFQVAVIRLGVKAADYFKKYPGRCMSAHLYDWSASANKAVPCGQGDVDWKELFAAADKCGVQNYFVEMNPEMFKDSAAYLLKL